MADNIPLEIQMQIFQKLSIKSLVRFRSVSKTWKSLIDNPHFISRYSGQATHLLVNNDNCCLPPPGIHRLPRHPYTSFADDHTFPEHRVPLETPQLMDWISGIIGGSHGLVCLHNYLHRAKCRMSMAVLWNPSIRKTVGVVLPKERDDVYSIVGFGVCRETVDPKIVKIACDIKSTSCVPCQVEVFPLSSRVWRSPHTNLPRKTIAFTNKQAVLDGCLYWLASDRITVDQENKTYNLVISFDMTSEEFKQVYLPDSLANHRLWPDYYDYDSLCISKLRESLAIVEQGVEDNNLAFTVWMMEDGVSKSFTKLYSSNVNTPRFDIAWVLGFRNNGEVIIQCKHGYYVNLVVYKPYSKETNRIGFSEFKYSYSVCSYKETLLLLDQPNQTVYHGKKTTKLEDDMSPEEIDSWI